MKVLGVVFAMLAFALPVSAQTGAAVKRAEPPAISELALQRSEYPASLSASCTYVGQDFDMNCAFFVSRVAARKSDKRVNDMLLRMFSSRTAEEWKDHPMCTTPEVKDIERHIKVMKVQNKLKGFEEQLIREQAAPAIAFCADPTMTNYKAYLSSLDDATSCTIDTTTETAFMKYHEDTQSWTGTFSPKNPSKPTSEYTIKLDAATGNVGKRLIFMVEQMIRPRSGGGQGIQLVYRATRSDQKLFCGYVEW
ncbi:hypothetical protein [Kordiimonas gwangyangensis]|uniref:hypothetical protein n=2 Tax=Kordiimonas gwangyangensis TaxID=288022 RepID=UPI0003705387|nr:hypothetical protein [Kordiimonas gwangyangensis]